MEKAFFDQFYEEEYKKLVAHYQNRESTGAALARIYQISILVTSVIAPIIVALPDQSARPFAIVVSSIVALLAGLGRVFRFEDAWINARSAKRALQREARFYHAQISDYADCESPGGLFVERITAIEERYNASQMTRIQESFREPTSDIKQAHSKNTNSLGTSAHKS